MEPVCLLRTNANGHLQTSPSFAYFNIYRNGVTFGGSQTSQFIKWETFSMIRQIMFVLESSSYGNYLLSRRRRLPSSFGSYIKHTGTLWLGYCIWQPDKYQFTFNNIVRVRLVYTLPERLRSCPWRRLRPSLFKHLSERCNYRAIPRFINLWNESPSSLLQ